MRSLFPGSYRPTEAEFEKLWAEAIFVFDTSMLLNFYRYSEETGNEFIGIVRQIKDRVWIPHHAAVEYHRRFHEVQYEQVRLCQEVVKDLEGWKGRSRAQDHRARAHQLLDLAKKHLAEAEAHYERDDRTTLEHTISELFEGKVGAEWGEEKLDEVYKTGAKRYEKAVPPGFKDKRKDKKPTPTKDKDAPPIKEAKDAETKPTKGDAKPTNESDGDNETEGDDKKAKDNEGTGNRRYGDLIIWLQMIDHAKDRGKPLIFVTDDLKPDWWFDVGGKKIGPHPSLRDEMHRTAGVAFYMYSGDNFLKQAKVRLRSVVSDKAVEEAKEVREEQQQPRGRLDPRLIEAFKMSLGPNFKVGGREPLWKPLRSHWMQRARSSYHDDIDFAPGDLERLLERMTPEERERLVANLERALGPVEEPREEPPEDVAKRHRDAAS